MKDEKSLVLPAGKTKDFITGNICMLKIFQNFRAKNTFLDYAIMPNL